MSVINDMLRDLDKRQAPEVSDSRQIPSESLIEPQKNTYKKWLVLLMGLLLIGVLVYGVLLQTKGEPPVGKEPISNAHVAQVNSQELMSGNIETERQGLPDTNKPGVSAQETISHSDIQIALKVEPEALTAKPSVVEVSTAEHERPSIKPDKEITHDKEANDKELTEKVLSEKTQTATVKKIAPKVIPKTASKELPKIAPAVERVLHKAEIIEEPQKRVRVEMQLDNTMEVTLSPIALDQQMAERATNLMAQGQELEAYRQLYKFIGEHAQNVESRTVLATYLLNENRMAEVGDVLLNAPISASPELRQIKARWYAAQDQHKLAIYTLSSDLPNVEEYPDYYVLLAAYYQRYGSALDASKAYSLLVDYNENVADWWAGLGLAADRSGQPEQAIFAYQQALELSGLSPELLNFVTPRLKQLFASTPNAGKKSAKQ